MEIADFVKRSEYKYDECEKNKENVGKLIYNDPGKNFDSIKYSKYELYPFYAYFEYECFNDSEVHSIVETFKEHALDLIYTTEYKRDAFGISSIKIIKLIGGFHKNEDITLLVEWFTMSRHLISHLITNRRRLLPKLDYYQN